MRSQYRVMSALVMHSSMARSPNSSPIMQSLAASARSSSVPTCDPARTLRRPEAGHENASYRTAAAMLNGVLATARPHDPDSQQTALDPVTGRPLTMYHACGVSRYSSFADWMRHLTSYGKTARGRSGGCLSVKRARSQRTEPASRLWEASRLSW